MRAAHEALAAGIHEAGVICRRTRRDRRRPPLRAVGV